MFTFVYMYVRERDTNHQSIFKSEPHLRFEILMMCEQKDALSIKPSVQ